MRQKKVLRNLGLISSLFAVLTIYCITLLNRDEALSHNNHRDDFIIVVSNKQLDETNLLVNADSSENDKTDNVDFEEMQIIADIDISNPLNKVKNHRSGLKQKKIVNLKKMPKVNESKLAELANPWELGITLFDNPQNYKLPGEDFNDTIPENILLQRMNSIRSSMKFSWNRYKTCAWGSDKLHPDKCSGSTWFGIGLTIIDSLDTMFLMGMKHEYNEAVEFVSNIDYRKGSNNVNIFEITIRVLGAFLTLLHFTQNQLYLSKAIELGDLLVNSGAFNTTSGVPLSDIDLSSGTSHMPTCSGCNKQSSLSEVTTIQLEFNELTRVTGDSKYQKATDRAMDAILKKLPPDGLPRNYVNVASGATTGTLTLGARGDSYYEYLLKQWIQTKNQRYWEEYLRAMSSIKEKLVFSSHRNLTYIAEITASNEISHKMDHLVCFLPGTLALGAHYGAPSWHLSLAEQVVRSCVEMYHTKSGLAPEIVKFDSSSHLFISGGDDFSLLRPETVESLFLLWRVTHKTKYRAWAWDIYSAIERSAKHPTFGFSSMDKINTRKPTRKGHLESFFLAETLKYLYLIHGPDDIIPIDRYVWNTEAHPFPIHTHSSTP